MSSKSRHWRRNRAVFRFPGRGKFVARRRLIFLSFIRHYLSFEKSMNAPVHGRKCEEELLIFQSDHFAVECSVLRHGQSQIAH